MLDGLYRDALTFYSLEGAQALLNRLAAFREERIAVAVMDMPNKCPVAPLEFAFLADWYFRERSTRDRIDITHVTPLDGAFTKPVAWQQLQALLENQGSGLVTEFNTGTLDAQAAKLVSYDGREVEFDLAVVVPPHGGAPRASTPTSSSRSSGSTPSTSSGMSTTRSARVGNPAFT